MTRILRRIGYWDGPAAQEGLPDVCDFVLADSDIAVQRPVAAYLRSGTVYVAAAGVSTCQLCGVANGNTELTDGAHFVWPEGLAHYVEEHGVRLPDEVVTVAARGTAPAVDALWFAHALLDTGELTIDTHWWSSLAEARREGATTEHLAGCRRSPLRAGWNLPTTADIYIDQVPQTAVAILVQLRKLLGAGWAFADLRRLITTQPFLAAPAGNPSALHRGLAQSPELRPYLFYNTEDGLVTVWPDN